MRRKRGISLGVAPAAVIMLVITGVVLVVGISINHNIATSELKAGEIIGVNLTSNVGLAAMNSTAGMQQMTSQMSLIGLIVAMAIVIGILFGAFGGMFGGRGSL